MLTNVFFLSFLVVVFFIFCHLETLLSKLSCLIGFLFLSSFILVFVSYGQWLPLAMLIALVSGLLVVLTFVILMFPTPSSKYFQFTSMGFVLLIPFFFSFFDFRNYPEMNFNINLKSEISQLASFSPFCSFFIFAILVLLAMLFIVETLIKPRSINTKM
uniref:NADH dehydrogenase subunit 6 n=1 Tax=Columbicola columbae TaxID=128991 RepID=A0A6G7SJI4_9NEOP|nr:NADH dehydrogenase subunit 6 [Columbicola columbae]